MSDRELLKMALEALEAMQLYAAAERKGLRICDEAIEALRTALAAPRPEPVFDGQSGHPVMLPRAPVPVLGLISDEVRAGLKAAEAVESQEAYRTRVAPPAPEPEPVAYFDPQGRGFYWAKPTQIDAPTTVDVPHLPLYASPPAAAPPDTEALRRDAEKWRKAQAKYIAWQKGGKAEAMQEDKT